MRDSPWYIVGLVVLIAGVMGYTHFTSEILTVDVTGKHVEDGRSRYGMSSEVFVIETDQGGMPLMEFPIIGYAFGAKDEYDRIVAGSALQVRVGYWPPRIVSSNARPQIMAIY